jgi:hypothetical protein
MQGHEDVRIIREKDQILIKKLDQYKRYDA